MLIFGRVRHGHLLSDQTGPLHTVNLTVSWEIESAFDELKTHQRGPRTVLRSKSPDPVLQEIWGHQCCHYAIRSLMADAAHRAGHDPDRVSFVAALRITRASIAQQCAFSPEDHHARTRLWSQAVSRLDPRRRARSAPRVIKRKYTKWHVKRAAHATWPQPQHEPLAHTITGAN